MAHDQDRDDRSNDQRDLEAALILVPLSMSMRPPMPAMTSSTSSAAQPGRPRWRVARRASVRDGGRAPGWLERAVALTGARRAGRVPGGP